MLSFAYTIDGVASVDVFSVDAAGNVGGNASRVTWLWDRSAPDTVVTVDGGVWLPGVAAWAVSSSTVMLSVSVNEAVSGVHVTRDGLQYVVSGLSVVLTNVSDGVHAVAAAGVDASGNEDATPATVTVFVDTVTPTTAVLAAPLVLTNASTVAVLLTAVNETAGSMRGFQLSSLPVISTLPAFVNVSGVSVTASTTVAGVPSGAYTVTARAVDAVGHVDAVGASFSFIVDLDAPTTRLVHTLTPFVNVSVVTVSVNASDALSSVSAFVRVDGGAWQSVSSSSLMLTLADGSHRIECRGVDAAGNTQAPPYDGVDVSVDTTPPWVSVAAGAVSAFNSLSVVSVAVGVGDATSTVVRGLLDGAVDSVVSRVGGGVVSVGVAADGNHTLVLSSEDAAGNAGAVVSVSWYTDRVSPVTHAHRDTPSNFNGAVANVSVSCVNEAFPGLCVVCWQFAVVSALGSTLTSMDRCESTSTLSFW
jgi:hypothetical protein